MRIGAIQKTTLLDYPGKVACTVFLPGCNLRCPFCHNPELVIPEQAGPEVPGEVFREFLRKRRGRLDGVCITGGEPTVHRDLPELIAEIRELGYLVKLDTNGGNPDMLQGLLQDGLLSYVAMDIKNCPDRYAATCGGPDILEGAQKSVRLLMDSGVDYEFRTTLCRPWHDAQAMEKIGQWLRGARRYYLQAFRDTGALVGTGCSAFCKEELQALLEAVRPYIPEAQLRGI